ncbi:MAG: TIR domain-containing protein [Gammaproteobacteria bacterium]
MSDIFLSYNREDQAVARRFATAFETHGFSVWWDATLRSGEAYDEVTEKALREAKAVVVLWSKKSVVSRWVRAEATLANRNKTLVPVMIEPCDRPIMFELTQTAELFHWQGDAADKTWVAFLGDVRRFVEAHAAPMRSDPAAPPPAPSQPPAVSRPSKASIVVLPFANMSGDSEQEYFSDGISEDIITDLSKVSTLSVTARNTAFTFKGTHVDVPQVARQLTVSHVLEGSVRKAGNRVRITAQLIDGATGAHVWAERYDRDLSDIFAVQDEISQAIVAALKVTLFPAEKKAIEERGTDNVEAYDKYLRARALFYQLGPTELARAIAIYREAVALDADFAQAWYGIYHALLTTLFWIPENAAAAAAGMAEASARVIALSPHAWWTQSMRAYQFLTQHRWAEAETAANAALAVAPASEVEASRSYAAFLWAVGRCKEAVAHLERARRLDPLSLSISGFLQIGLGYAGRSEEAQAEFERSKDLAGDRAIWEWIALLRLWRRRDADSAAVKAQFDVFLSHESLPMALNHFIAGTLGDEAAARVAIREAFEDPAYQDATRTAVLGGYADHFGDKDLVLAALRRHFIDLNGTSFHNLYYPFETGVRSDPRFKELVRELGLVDYWRASGNWGDFARPVGTDDFECW